MHHQKFTLTYRNKIWRKIWKQINSWIFSHSIPFFQLRNPCSTESISVRVCSVQAPAEENIDPVFPPPLRGDFVGVLMNPGRFSVKESNTPTPHPPLWGISGLFHLQTLLCLTRGGSQLGFSFGNHFQPLWFCDRNEIKKAQILPFPGKSMLPFHQAACLSTIPSDCQDTTPVSS